MSSVPVDEEFDDGLFPCHNTMNGLPLFFTGYSMLFKALHHIRPPGIRPYVKNISSLTNITDDSLLTFFVAKA